MVITVHIQNVVFTGLESQSVYGVDLNRKNTSVRLIDSLRRLTNRNRQTFIGSNPDRRVATDRSTSQLFRFE